MRLYLVEASYSDYDDFTCGVVYANSPDDACTIVRETCERRDSYELPGAWWSIDRAATLTATPVERKRGPVLAYGTAG